MFLNGELLFPQYLTAFNGYPDANVIYDFTVSPTSVAELGDTLSLCFTGDVIISSMEECETHGFNVTYDTLTTVAPISNSSTRIVLSLPERNATTTENPIFFWKYYVNNETASTSQYVMQKISIRPIKRNFWGSVTTGDPYQIIEREAQLRDFYVSENETLTFPDGIYEWQGELQIHRDRECSFYDCFIQILANTNSGTTTIATSTETTTPTTVPATEQLATILDNVGAVEINAIVNILEMPDISQTEVASAVQQILEQEITSEQATELATSEKVLSSIDAEQASAIFDAIDINNIDITQAAAIVEAVQNAPVAVRAEFEDKIDVFNGKTDTYIPIGSSVNIGVRRVLIVSASFMIAIPPAPPISRKQ